MHDYDDYLRRFIAGYCHALLWADTYVVRDGLGDLEEEVEPAWWQTPSRDWPLEAFAQEDRFTIAETCDDFVQAQWLLLLMIDSDPERAGHDFLLTRNRHGAGFWDRGYGVVGRMLTDASRPYGSTSAYTHPVDELEHDRYAHLMEG